MSPLSIFGILLMIPTLLAAQAVKGSVTLEDGPPTLTYHGLIPGFDNGVKARQVLGEPTFAAPWYDYKMYYPARARKGLFDVVHLHGPAPEQGLANIEAASVPEGFETASKVIEQLGDPEFRLKMATWSLLDYSEKGLRFSLDANGNTNGVAYFPHGRRRVPTGERREIDLSRLRQGPQPEPASKPSLSGLEVGTAEVVISPQEQSWLPEPFEIHDDLLARIVVLSYQNKTVALVGADLFGMGAEEISVIRKSAAEQGVGTLILAMSHNHAAPDTIGVYGHYPKEYISFLQKRIVEGVMKAKQDLHPVSEIRVASAELPMDGVRVQDLFRNARNSGLLDPTISAVQLRGDGGTVLATLVHFACHVESLAQGARFVGADFPGVMADRLQKRGGGQVVFLNGAVGGMVSGDNRERNFASSTQMGERLADEIGVILKTASSVAEFDFEVDRREIEIPMMNPNFRPLFEAGLRELRYGRVQTDMIYFRFAGIDLITLPGELLPEVGFEILEQMSGFPRILVDLANDQLGYMIPPYDFREGSYEESMSQGPSAALIVRDTALRMLHDR